MPPKKGVDSPMSAFERRRQENMASNQKILADVAVVAKKVMPTPQKKSTPTRSKTRTPAKREPAMPTRQSSRLAGLDADNDTLKRKLAVEAEHVAAEAKAKRLRVNGDLKLGDIAVEGKKYLAGVDGFKGLVRGAQPGVRTFTEEDIKETTDKDLKELRKRMGGLKLYEHWAPNGKYCLAQARSMSLTAEPQTSRSHPNESMLSAFIPPNRNPLSLLATKKVTWAYLTLRSLLLK